MIKPQECYSVADDHRDDHEFSGQFRLTFFSPPCNGEPLAGTGARMREREGGRAGDGGLLWCRSWYAYPGFRKIKEGMLYLRFEK